VAGDDIAIRIDGVSKMYRKYTERSTSLKERITKVRGDRYEEFWALKDVDLEIEKGAFYGFVGHNGSGKSTLLKMIAGVHKPTKGSIAVDGRVTALLELGAGFHPDLSGRENIYLNASIMGLRRKETDKLLDEIVDFSQIEELADGNPIDAPVKTYSSGMFVRLGFSVAVHLNPEILLIDEVIAVGDEEFQRRCFEHLYKLRSEGVTIVFVTHALSIVQNVCSGAAWFDHGVKQLDGTPNKVVRGYVKSVNTREEARLESEAAADPTGHTASGAALHPIVIEKAEWLEPDGTPTLVATTGAPLTVRFHWRATEPVKAPVFTIGIKNDAGIHVGVIPMRPGDHDAVLEGEGFIDYTMPSLVLAPGEFMLGVDIHDQHAMVRYDHHEDLLALRVVPNDEDFVMGVANLGGRWEKPVSL
jgi:ABC-type polysaccharide/polyol phosphate transport system ATPase subunit